MVCVNSSLGAMLCTRKGESSYHPTFLTSSHLPSPLSSGHRKQLGWTRIVMDAAKKTKLSLTGIELRFEDPSACSPIASLWDVEGFVATRCLVFSLRFVANCCFVFSLHFAANCRFVFSLHSVANRCSVFSLHSS
jgi:hypothetical protein